MHFRILSWYSIEQALPFRVPALHGGPNREGSGSQRGQEIYIPLVLHPLDSARHAVCLRMVTTWKTTTGKLESFLRGNGPLFWSRPVLSSVLFFACFLTAPLASQSFFHALSFARLQVKRVTFHFLNNVLSLYLSLEAPQRVFEGFSLLKSNFRQRTTPPNSS
jgi:hypothetical protein